jgi:hypothetical protein
MGTQNVMQLYNNEFHPSKCHSFRAAACAQAKGYEETDTKILKAFPKRI